MVFSLLKKEHALIEYIVLKTLQMQLHAKYRFINKYLHSCEFTWTLAKSRIKWKGSL